jgi:hypothetical protein
VCRDRLCYLYAPHLLTSEPSLTRRPVAIVFCLIFAAGLARRRRAARMQQAFRAQGAGVPTGPVLTEYAWSQHVAGGPALPPTAYSGGYAPAYMTPVRPLLGRLRVTRADAKCAACRPAARARGAVPGAAQVRGQGARVQHVVRAARRPAARQAQVRGLSAGEWGVEVVAKDMVLCML